MRYLLLFSLTLGLGFLVSYFVIDRDVMLVWSALGFTLTALIWSVQRTRSQPLSRSDAKLINNLNHLDLSHSQAEQWDEVFTTLCHALAQPHDDVREAALNRTISALWTEHRLRQRRPELAGKTLDARVVEVLNAIITTTDANILQRVRFTPAWLRRRQRISDALRSVIFALQSAPPTTCEVITQWLHEYQSQTHLLSDNFLSEMHILMLQFEGSREEFCSTLLIMLQQDDPHLRAAAGTRLPTLLIQTTSHNLSVVANEVESAQGQHPGSIGPFAHAVKQNWHDLTQRYPTFDFAAWLVAVKQSGHEDLDLAPYPQLESLDRFELASEQDSRQGMPSIVAS